MRFNRFALQIGEEQLNNLATKTVCVVGVGGVGSYAIEALGRSNFGKIIIIDNDVVDETNINRQLIALSSTIGLKKTHVMKERLHDINPNVNVIDYDIFLDESNIDTLFAHQIDFLIDAIDTLSTKFLLIKKCLEKNIPFISSMGTANMCDPSKFFITDLRKTTINPLARILRKRVREENIIGQIPVLTSSEIPVKQEVLVNADGLTYKEKYPPASNAYTPSIAGLLCAGYVINTLLKG